MSSYTELLLEKYKTKGLLIDANLLLLYLIGSYDLRLVGDGKYNKLSKYTVKDYHLLLRCFHKDSHHTPCSYGSE